MATTPTNKPIPSEDPRDLKFNAGKIDEEVNGSADYYTDRFGVQRLTNTGRNNQFDAAQLDRANRFEQFLLSSGYVFLGDYEDGPFQFSARNQYIRYNNQYYRLNAATDVGFTTTGTDAASFASDVTHFVLMDGDTLRQNLASSDPNLGGALVSLPQGGNINQSIIYITPEQNGAVGDCVEDDSDEVQAAIDKAASRAVQAGGIYIPQFVVVSRVYRLKKPLNIDGTKVRLVALGGGGFYFDPAGTYPDNRAIIVTGSSSNAAYVGQSGALFDGLTFITSGKTLDLFYAIRNSAVSGDNGACLHNVVGITARGFGRIFTHGSGGWGWTWTGCQFSGCNNLMNIVTASDTYERHSFFGCTWQNGGYAFIMNNPDGKIYWHGGSIDYCDGLAQISQGHLEANGHNEWTARSMPLVVITGSNASVAVSGTMFVRNNTSTLYYIFQQFQRRQVSLRDVTFITDGTNVSLGVISNLEVVKHNLTFPNDSAKGIAYHSSDENLINTTTLNADYSLSVTTNHTVSVSGGVITVTSTAGGTTSHLYIDIPVVGRSRIAFKMIASNTSTAGAISLNKSLLTLSKTQIADLSSSGTASWAASASSVAGGSVTVFEITKQAGYLRLDFNVANLTTGTSFIIESLKMFSY